MKFIKLDSRGGNYLVVASNVAWLRTAENGQTSVGIVGGQPLLVVGSVEEVAEKILSGLAETAGEAAPAPAAPAPAPEPLPAAPTSASAPVAAPTPEPEPLPAVEAEIEPETEPDPQPEPAASQPQPAPPVKPGGARPRVVSARSASMWERPSTPPKIKATSQRMMGGLD